MQVYLVGGAVRDKQLGRPIKDKDFVVVGATVAQMLENNFIQIGSDFPVFLHPTTKQEYALARTERKSGQGYKGFVVHADTSVTLEQDLSRRDLTINAMAVAVKGLFDDTPITGKVIDPFDGLNDIAQKKLRHVSHAFSEDPLRVLRVARFYGRFVDIGFEVADATLVLLTKLSKSGELEHLTRERIWTETHRALMQPSPQAYWQLLNDIGAMPSLYPNLADAWQDTKCREYIYSALELAGELDLSLAQRWAITMASFAQSCADTAVSSAHYQEDTDWTAAIKQCARVNKLPKKLTQFALLYANYADFLLHFDRLTAEQMATLITACKAHKDSQSLQDLLMVSHIMQLTGQRHKLNRIIQKFNSITIDDIDTRYQGAQIGAQISKLRIKAIQSI